MTKEKSKAYDPKQVEDKIYQFWVETGLFNPDKLPGDRKEVYTIALPPPNVTGELHMGHALNATIQDILIRWKRLHGFKALWIPGTDHAGIATQVRVEKMLSKEEGKTRFDLGKEEFIKRVWGWKDKYGNIILDQFKKLGSSLDWSRTAFTMDKGYSEAVEKAFLTYYEKGWVYKEKRPINWCARCQTSLSDFELEYSEEKGNLWYIKYAVKDEKGKYITVATTRPETMLGDTGLAVNPKDKRFKGLVGKTAILPLIGRELPIVKDDLVDPEFGTGVVKVTPAHDLKDYEMGIKHKLDIIQVIDDKNKMTKDAGEKYENLKTEEAREKVLADLKELNLIEKIEDYTNQVPICYRCSKKIATIPSEQWFVSMKELGKMAEKEVKDGRIKFVPERFEKTYFDRLQNLRDWCISRQLWWGHRVPVENSEDVLDTWFSSALWPFATLGWPKKTKDLETFYPNSVLTTDRGIIHLWVQRMIFSGMEFMKEKPFSYVYIHPTVLTKDGKRMSKSLGTGIDPMVLIDKYGADSTRFGLAWYLTGGQDMRFSEDSIIMGKKFCNKIWNASKFVLMQIQDSDKENLLSVQEPEPKTKADKKILDVFKNTVKEVDKNLEVFGFGQAAQSLYDFFWHDFCDKYLEESKIQIKDAKSVTEAEKTKKLLLYILTNSLKLLHPFIPFVTEEIYQSLPLTDKKESLMVEVWPGV